MNQLASEERDIHGPDGEDISLGEVLPTLKDNQKFEELRRSLAGTINPDGQTSLGELKTFIDGAIGDLSPEEKMVLSQSYALEALSHSGIGELPVNVELSRLTQTLVDKMTVGTEAEGVQVLVVEAASFEAAPLDGNTIIISSNFVEQLSERQFKALLRHEIGHIAGGDVLRERLAHIYVSEDMPGKVVEQRALLNEYQRGREHNADQYGSQECPEGMVDFLKFLQVSNLGQTDGSGTHPTHEDRLKALESFPHEHSTPDHLASSEFRELQAVAGRVEAERLQVPEQARFLAGIGTLDWEHPLDLEKRKQILAMSLSTESVTFALETGQEETSIRKVTTGADNSLARSEFFDHMRFGLSLNAQIAAIRVEEPIMAMRIDETGTASFINSSGVPITIPQTYERETTSGRIVSWVGKDNQGNAYRSLVFHPNQPTSGREVLRIHGLDPKRDERRLLEGLSGVISHKLSTDRAQ